MGLPWFWATAELSLPDLDLLKGLPCLWCHQRPVGVCCPCYCLRVAVKPEIHVDIPAQCCWRMIWWYPPTLLPLGSMLMWVACVALYGYNEGHEWVSGIDSARGSVDVCDLNHCLEPCWCCGPTVTMGWKVIALLWHECGRAGPTPPRPLTIVTVICMHCKSNV